MIVLRPNRLQFSSARLAQMTVVCLTVRVRLDRLDRFPKGTIINCKIEKQKNFRPVETRPVDINIRIGEVERDRTPGARMTNS
jgi:hypothetical protein